MSTYPSANNMLHESPKWTLITVTYNSEKMLNTFWENHTHNDLYHWVVVDNASKDKSADIAEKMGAKVIRLSENVGFGAANNIGFTYATTAYVSFVNPDISVKPEDLVLLKNHIDANPNDLVSPQLINEDGSLQPNGRGYPSLVNKIRNRRLSPKLNGTYLKFALPGETKSVEWLMGAVVAGSRERLDLLGPWDERFFVYYEDSDLGLRNTKINGRSIVLGDAQWVHGWARETKNLSWRAWKLEIPSLIKFYSRYPRLLGISSIQKID
ncbi:glycosyltransferase [Arthrobacter sp. lap29]|uniref:glycosyltransferase n=1 Tax=Arthrobacter sp. lap29 TaxID=3056122 RepID=UPI0028F6F69E|nr:glycosyltransferase [Arthrobacter sp. lap29]